MVTENYEQYFKLGKNFLNPWNDMGKTVMDLYRRASQESMEIAGANLTRSADQLKRICSVRRPDDLMAVQKDIINENTNALVGHWQKCLDLASNSFEELNKAMSSNIKEQQQNVKSSVKAAEERTK